MLIPQGRRNGGEMATEIQLIPIQELATGQAASIRNTAIQAVVSKASTELKLAIDKLIVRDIQPLTGLDLDYTYETWYEVTGASTAAYETMSTGTMGADRYIGIYGIRDDSGDFNVTKIKINVGNSDKVIWHLQNLYPMFPDGPKVGFSPSVVILPPNLTYTISRYVVQSGAPAQIVLKGFVVERYGKVLSP